VYYQRKPEIQHIKEKIIEYVTKELEEISPQNESDKSLTQSHSSRESDSFWGNFDKNAASNEKDGDIESVESEIHRWGEQSTLRRDANPVHAMEVLKENFPRIYLLFRKYCVLPATQNKDEHVFSFVARNTQPLCRQIKVETIETSRKGSSPLGWPAGGGHLGLAAVSLLHSLT
jgi:hypothetical protein